MLTLGIFFRFLEGPVGIASSLKSTIELYLEPLRKANVDPSIAALNVDFLEKYSQINKHIQKRGITDVHIDENEIQSGDLLAIVRLDGLDPMLGWAMGSTTGHLTVWNTIPIPIPSLPIPSLDNNFAYGDSLGCYAGPNHQ